MAELAHCWHTKRRAETAREEARTSAVPPGQVDPCRPTRLQRILSGMSDAVTRLNAALEGRYAIERELGEGGMATVYLGDDLRLASRQPEDTP